MVHALMPLKHNKKYTLQALKECDLSSLLELETQAFPLDSWDKDIFLSELANETSTIKIIKCQKRVIGYVHLETYRRKNVLIGEIGSLAVADDHRGKGLGARLLKHGISQLQKNDSTVVHMQTRLDNVAMKSLAEKKFGFITTKIQKNVYKDGSPAFQMTLPLVLAA